MSFYKAKSGNLDEREFEAQCLDLLPHTFGNVFEMEGALDEVDLDGVGVFEGLQGRFAPRLGAHELARGRGVEIAQVRVAVQSGYLRCLA